MITRILGNIGDKGKKSLDWLKTEIYPTSIDLECWEPEHLLYRRYVSCLARDYFTWNIDCTSGGCL